MELNIISKTETELEVEFKGETHTLLNSLKDFMLRDERVDIAYYDMKHVSISEPVLYIKTDGTDPLVVLRDAASGLIASCDEFTEVFNKAVRA
ncbi:MAG: DNA-directed RNA polymerase subunit L [Methanosarcinaceae archaeon]|nr:DNA-directed RNA polymerase subunit L [Methanosarcinaceae archaeon]MDD4331244.1 DNA-directed RNA polymerase subunit L [Methanosarcinaceae archaeon]MDD4749258.1 DNA-directed RNA polymerase subunit L [Methanosarcinaceae archaeon]